MSKTPDRHNATPDYDDFIQMDSAGSTLPTGEAQQSYANNAFWQQDAIGSFDVRRPFVSFLDGAVSDVSGTSLYQTFTYNGIYPNIISWYRDAAKTKLHATQSYTFAAGAVVPSTIVTKIYAADGSTVRRTCTDTYSYSGIFPTGCTRVVS